MADPSTKAATEPSIVSRKESEGLLTRLVEIASVSGEEREASRFLVGAMQTLGFDRSEVDAAGNVVGEMGAASAGRTIVLLGHIDTVYGDIPVRVERGEAGPILFGRGSVDAKGSLATFATAVARLGSDWARRNNTRLVVVGAVEEEAATSKGARFIRDRFDGCEEPVPDYCIIGEPSGSTRLTLFYKGRILLDMEASQPMMHSAGPNPGVAVNAVDLWNWIDAFAEDFNRAKAKMPDRVQPSLREIRSWTDETMQDRVWAKIGLRLPLGFRADDFLAELWGWAQARAAACSSLPLPPFVDGKDATRQSFRFGSDALSITFSVHGFEPAWRGDRGSPLARSFLAAIREQSSDRPRFVSKSGTSDMNVVGPAWACPIVAYGPGDSALDHTPAERLNLNEYWQAVSVLETALRRLP